MTLVDTNVLLDILTDDPQWAAWSEQQFLAAAATGELAINPIIYAGLAAAYRTVSDLERALRNLELRRRDLPYEAAFLAGHAFHACRKKHTGPKRSPLPDFYIGAHAQHERLTLLTRDAARYRTYFPKLNLIAPDLT
jgi:predicted nucleic acid-binding protein